MDKKFIRIIDADDTELDVELISILENENGRYLVYSKGEKQKNNNLIIYVSKLRVKEGNYYLENIHDDSEWNQLKLMISGIINR